MATLLVNRKMNPALARRIEVSVTGTRNQTIAHSSARWVSRIRLVVVSGLLALALSIYLSLRHEYAELRHARASLFAQWNAHTGSLTPKDKDFLKRVEKSLSQLHGQYPGDTIAEELRDPGAISALLARPAVYIRGPLSSFANSAGIAKAAAESGKDTLLLCLIDPPTSHDEKAMLEKARLALFGGSSVQPIAPNVLRLYDAELGLPVMLPPWGDRIQGAKDQQSLRQLERELERAPLSLAKRVLRAEILIAAFDEPNNKGSTTELDGEAGHDIRLAVKQLDPEKTLFWLRRTVDPKWITPQRRPGYARELDGCRFALDVREVVRDSFKPVEAASN
jgi:hypothetical protein